MAAGLCALAVAVAGCGEGEAGSGGAGSSAGAGAAGGSSATGGSGGSGGAVGASTGGSGGQGGAPGDERFLFCSTRTGTFQLFRREAGVDAQLTDDALHDSWWPRISPDRARIVFYRSLVTDRPPTGGWDNNYEHASLWMMDADGGNAHELLSLASQGWAAQGVANWSPDGTSLVMAARDATSGLWELHVMAVDGGAPERVSQRESFYVDPSWSPVGDKLIFGAFPPDAAGIDLAQLEIYGSNVDGSAEIRLTDDAIRDHDPSWSPDGTSIVFESEMDPAALRWALRTIAVPGGQVATLIDDGNINTLGRWMPGGALTFHRFVLGEQKNWRISRIERDGTGLLDLTSGEHEDVDADPY